MPVRPELFDVGPREKLDEAEPKRCQIEVEERGDGSIVWREYELCGQSGSRSLRLVASGVAANSDDWIGVSRAG